MATSSPKIISEIILRQQIHTLKLNMEDEEGYLQTLECVLQPLIKAKRILDRAIAVVKEYEGIEKQEPSWKEDPERCKEVEEAIETQEDAKKNYARLLDESKFVVEKYKRHQEKLQGFEDKYEQTKRLLGNLYRSWQGKAEGDSPVPVLDGEERMSAEAVVHFNEQRLPLEELNAQTKVYLKF